MTPDRHPFESRIDALEERLARVEQHLAAMKPGAAIAAPEWATPGGPHLALPVAGPRPVEIVPLIGRTLVVLGGAFVLRTMTEWQVLGPATGAFLGFVYALAWLVPCDRDAARDRSSSATFHALASAVIGFPLVWEATAKFHFIGPHAAAAALLVLAAAGLVVAWRRNRLSLVWIFTTGAAGTMLVLATVTQAMVLFTACLLVVGLTLLWCGVSRGWAPVAWAVAALIDVWLVLMTSVTLLGAEERVRALLDPRSLVALQVVVVVAYLGTFIARSIAGDDRITSGTMAQGIGALVAGLGGAIAVTRATDLPGWPLGLASLLLAVGAYGASFAFIDRRQGTRRAFIYFSSVALAFALVAFDELLGGAALVAALAVTAFVAGWVGWRHERATLSLHAAVYAMVAIAASSTPRLALETLIGSPAPPRAWVAPSVLLALGATAACCALPVASHGRTWGRSVRAPKLVVLAALLFGLAGATLAMISTLLPASESGSPDPAALAVARTGVLALGAVLLAAIGRPARLPQATWLVYPLLVLGGLELAVVDLRVGRPATLALSLAFYGIALVLAPRLARRGREPRGLDP